MTVTTTTAPSTIPSAEELEHRRLDLNVQIYGLLYQPRFEDEDPDYYESPVLGADVMRDFLAWEGNEWLKDALEKDIFSNATEKRRKHLQTAFGVLSRALTSAKLIGQMRYLQSEYGNDLIRTLVWGRYGVMVTLPRFDAIPWNDSKNEEFQKAVDVAWHKCQEFDDQEQRAQRRNERHARRGKSANQRARAEQNRAMANAGKGKQKG